MSHAPEAATGNNNNNNNNNYRDILYACSSEEAS
jgi:hypothetical protein